MGVLIIVNFGNFYDGAKTEWESAKIIFPLKNSLNPVLPVVFLKILTKEYVVALKARSDYM